MVRQISDAPDPAQAEQAFEDERDFDGDPVDELWGLDVGVAAAVQTLSALGAVPFMSCNGGSFGKPHAGSHPYVAFFLANAQPTLLESLAKASGVGLTVRDGIPRLYARSIFDFHRFAAAALEVEAK